jgi:hypothetical protein
VANRHRPLTLFHTGTSICTRKPAIAARSAGRPALGARLAAAFQRRQVREYGPQVGSGFNGERAGWLGD